LVVLAVKERSESGLSKHLPGGGSPPDETKGNRLFLARAVLFLVTRETETRAVPAPGQESLDELPSHTLAAELVGRKAL